LTLVKYTDIIDMEKKGLRNYQESDSESESLDSSSDTSSNESSGPDFLEFAKQLRFKNNSIFEGYENTTSATIEFPSTFTKKEDLPKTQDITTLFLIDSVNRDKTAFPQPTSFSLRLPRTYKNVKSIQLTEVKLLCSFYYFSRIKSNIYLPIIERGRESITTYNGIPISKLIKIREGTYNINDLLSEIQTRLNYTPLFYDFQNGFTDFINIFTVSGDYSVNFNEPGDTYYDSLNSKTITNPTMATIISYYWGSRYANLTNYSIDQVKVAYYYPVLYEVLLDLEDTIARPSLDLSPPPNYVSLDGLPASSHVIFNMSGINDYVALFLINNNIDLLDKYRLNHTFRYSLVNRYDVTYDTNSLNVNFTTIGLNTSLINLLNNTSASALASSLYNNGLTAASFSNLQASIGITTVIYNDMYNFLQIQLASLLGISYGTYSASFFNNLNNLIYFQDGTNALGVSKKYNANYIQSGQSAISSSQTKLSDSPILWPNLVKSNGYNGTGILNVNSQNNLIPYNISGKNFLFGSLAIDPVTSYLNVNTTSQTLDVVINIMPAQYTIIKFKSPIRQTLQVETLGLPYYYRYSDFNIEGRYTGVLDLDKQNVPQQYFDISYSYVYDLTNQGMDINNYTPNVLAPSFGIPFNESFLLAQTISITSLNNYFYFEFTSPRVPEISPDIPTINNTSIAFVSINLLNLSTTFTDSFTAFIYHDRGAFMADLGRQRSENPLHYIASITTTPSSSDLTINLSTFSGHKYYSIFRSNNLVCSKNRIKPLIYYNNSSYIPLITDLTNFDPNANPYNSSNLSTFAYVANYNTDFIRLPVASTLMNIDPSDPIFNNTLIINNAPIGYDSNGVSNDLTDYIGFNTVLQSVDPTSKFRIDPLNNFIFNSNTPYNSRLQSYINSNSSNFILFSTTNDVYSFAGTSTSQIKIVQWYEGYSIPFQLDDNIRNFDNMGVVQTSSLSRVLSTFPVNSNTNNIIFGRGVNAIGFLPTDGIYNVESFSFKSCLYPLTGNEPSQSDPNLNIKYIGVFSGNSLTTQSVLLSSAISVLKFTNAVAYGPQTVSDSFTYGTWYQYTKDTSFISDNSNINGYTPDVNALLNYASMYYMVPFNEQGFIITYTLLSGSILPNPLEQTYTFSTVYLNNQVATPTPGSVEQPGYIIPIYNISSIINYDPTRDYTQIQSQYEQSMAITTPSIGYKEKLQLVNINNAPYKFNTSFYNTSTIGFTTFFSEFSDTVYLVNSTSNISSNLNTSFPTANYASSLSTVINLNSGNVSCINFMNNPAPVLQNYSVDGVNRLNRVFSFSQMSGDDSNITIQSIELSTSMSNLTLWMWGGGGGSISSFSTSTGGAGAYVKVNINPQVLLNTATTDSPGGISTLYIVVGKGGNLDNFPIENVVGSLQSYEEIRYGGGGTTLSGNFVDANSITAQGGGFSGIFSGSNILTATPLLIVGGGGAAGSSSFHLGGPGGIGIVTPLLSTTTYNFSAVTFNGEFYNRLPILSILDVFNTPIKSGSNVNSTLDNNFLTYWGPVIPAKLNPSNYFSTANTYGISLNFSNSITNISKIRFYGSIDSDIFSLPTGFILYNDINKQQILYSNTSINYKDYDIINNNSFLQQVYDIIPTTQLTNTTIQSNAWIVGGINSANKILQYSLDSIDWIPIKNIPIPIVTTVHYSSNFNKWFASGSGIIYSVNGINWIQSIVAGINNLTITKIVSGNSILVAGASDGTILVSLDGIEWNIKNKIFNTSINRIRFINGKFWGLAGTTLKNSVDGITWVSIMNFTNSTLNDIAYGIGYYIITQNNGTPGDPLISGIIYSSDGITWNSTNIRNFSGFSVVYGNDIFVACGVSTDNTSFIKYSLDGIVWINSNLLTTGDLQRTNIEFLGSKFISVGQSASGTGLAGNQVSILTSLNGKDWSYILSGGYDPDAGSYSGKTTGYGPVTILPNMSTLYLEIQKTAFITSEPKLYELRVYDSVNPIVTNTTSLIDTNLTTIFYPSELNTIDVIDYPFIFSFLTPVPMLNCIEIYTPSISAAQLTGIRIALDNTGNTVIYDSLNVVQDSVTIFNTIQYNYYKIVLLSPVTNISSLYITCFKDTPGSMQIAGINCLYDPNVLATQKILSSVQDLDNRIPFSQNTTLANTIDSNLSTYWKPATFIQGDSLKFVITFSETVDRINRIRIVNGLYPPDLSNLITGIGIFTDSTKSSTIYFDNTNLMFTQYLTYTILDIDIIPITNYRSLYIELYKNIPGIPIINEFQFFNLGNIINSTSGYSGGQVITMTRSSTAISLYDGGGGTATMGGSAGLYADKGEYLTGGSPAVLTANQLINTTSNILVSAGGGGGGYYGGGGGGLLINGAGGAGGGGAGYIFQTNPIFTILDYGVAVPTLNGEIQNYISPGKSEQDALAINKIILQPSIYYGQGGNVSINSGKGQHGLVVFSYTNTLIVPSNSTANIYPVFIDGSKLSVFQASISYDSDIRELSFIPYKDSIHLTTYSTYNWIWYRSYLSLVGNYLTTSFIPGETGTKPPPEFPSLPLSIYSELSQLFSTITTAFSRGTLSSSISTISDSMDTIFTTFQNTFFIQTLYTDPSYIEFTEIYCLLDYLRNPVNLANPHVNPSNPTLDRILGGIPRFGYWANPFFTNASYIGFDVAKSQIPQPSLSTIASNGNPVQAIYALVLEQTLSSGVYGFKDIIAYKPTLQDSVVNGSKWLTVTQFPEAYAVRSLTNTVNADSNVIVQPYTFANAITARLQLFNYSVYSIPAKIKSITYDIPVQILNDFEGQFISMYSFQNNIISDITSINLSNVPFTSTMIYMNQERINNSSYTNTGILGTLVSEYQSTIVNAITSFTFDTISFTPVLQFSPGSNNFYNTYSFISPITSEEIGKAFIDHDGNYYMIPNNGGNVLYQNNDPSIINPVAFNTPDITYTSPKFILNEYNNGNTPPTEIFVSKFSNIWHLTISSTTAILYGARLTSQYDLGVVTSFANQVFYPTHKITLVKTGSLENPIVNTGDTEIYPSYHHTNMFFYNNFSSLKNDIDGKFAMEKAANFAYSDAFSGYNFNSFISNIILEESDKTTDPDSYNYLAIRGYSPTEKFQCVVRFYLPQRYDYGFISLIDLSNREQLVANTTVVNPNYKSLLSLFNSSFSTNRAYGSVGMPGFAGSNISTTGFGDFLKKFNTVNTLNTNNNALISSVTSQSNTIIYSLITNDLSSILPSYLATRNRITDPIEFSIPFSSCVDPANRTSKQYGLGYNLGFELQDTDHNTVQRGTSFFKILDDYIYLQMNEEFKMNRMDISKPENFSKTRDTTAQTGLYNSKLILNTFGSFATTFVQSPVTFNPVVGKIDKLTFSWYDSAGVILNNADCEWSGTVQIVEAVNTT
jgi:hypothetical protein